ncbi:tetratricopeptide repeat protein [Altererythrobacter aquiaggeris]|uniref:tetratricopeptide repeat protein n=1 Tax=Aestuarierythrobacter aquiaggeris TaxID=1898396 RepID=UPI003019094B
MVQPLPPEGVDELNRALGRLARNSSDVSALVDAGTAALKLDDTDAAIGFFGRANELSPGNARVKIGLAGAYVRRESPLQALQLFDEAERAGVSSIALAGDRGLAYDLVGDTGRAQIYYRQALAAQADGAISRRLAISQAIAGDRAAFEATLLPQLQTQDLAAFRTRSFGLAILGDDEEAIDIAQAVMPRTLSRRITPYLRYMKQLTPAQQAAAAHFGNFPMTARIGRDDPRIAGYSPPADLPKLPGRQMTDTDLTPQGAPLGPRSSERVAVTSTRTGTVIAARPSPPPPGAGPALAAAVASQTSAPAGQLPAVVVSEVPGPSVSVAANITASPAAPATALPKASGDAAEAVLVPAPIQAETPASVEAAFAGFKLPTATATAPSGGIDITRITPPREVKVEERKPSVPDKPAVPSRIWVQVATGQDRNALKFDWRKFSRKAPEQLASRKAYIASWNQTNRLVTGPFDSIREARAMVTVLGAQDIDSFIFTSAEGEQVDPLP